MRKINFTADVLPHAIAIAVFLVVTIFFFKPVFLENKKIHQDDIQQWEGSSKALRDFRDETGEEGLWVPSMFSGMPAYLVNVQWGNQVVSYLKTVMAFWMPHPIGNIFLAFVSYYILLLAFGVRPYLAIAGAIAFGLSSYMIIGLSAGHNGRIGAIALMPLVMAGIHLVFTGKKFLGFGVTTAGFALHLRENHLQITYYLAIIVMIYGLVQLITYYKNKELSQWAKNVGLLIPAVIIAIGSFIGPLWGVTEYSAYSTRGKSELTTANNPEATNESGMSKQYAFEFSYGILEPMTLLIPQFYGGATSNFLVQNEDSETFKALANARDKELVNQLANYTSAYWGPQRMSAPYYAGAIIVFLFALGVAFADKKVRWWLVSLTVLGIVLSWGKSFEAFNYFLFDYLPGYNKFRSVTFALVIALFAMPLLGFIGLENVMTSGLNKAGKKKLLIVLGLTGGLCLLSLVFSGMLSFMRDIESQLPSWFVGALAEDRQNLLTSDAIRSLMFIIAAFVVIYFEVYKKLAPVFFYVFIIFMITIDLSVVDKRYLSQEQFQRKRGSMAFVKTEADEEILKDKSYYRVFTLGNSLSDTWNEAQTSYFHNSIGGYHGAKLNRYQDLLDSCLYRETAEFIQDAQSGNINFPAYGILNMLNTKYIKFGTARNAVMQNTAANGNAWFVDEVITAKSATEELKHVCNINTATTAVVDVSRFTVPNISADSLSDIRIVEHKPNYLKYEADANSNGLVVFSEIYYEKGWRAFIDSKETPILRANYVLRALPVPQGKHIIEFKFEPKAYFTGNAITTASSWLMLLVLLGSIGLSLRKRSEV
ncbi:MAG TPA: YfhO family protein [Ohtaekwangia sp.]|nr:YfhO family protein [Ohtaekwangia sp.]